jgi:hypothetical protein
MELAWSCREIDTSENRAASERLRDARSFERPIGHSRAS